jgi:hypothetical protein
VQAATADLRNRDDPGSTAAFQATGLPARCAHLGPVGRLLGTTFSWHDVVCYCVGVAGIFGVDVLLLRPAGRGR